jgi:large subunit ribosomal protein L23
MALRDIFKKKPKEKPKTTILPPPEAPPEGRKVVGGVASRLRRAPIKKEVAAVPKRVPRKTVAGEAYRVLKTPQVTEKATGLVGQNQYVFKVWPKANKVETKKAIENLYGVDVISVKIIKVPRKRRRLGRISGWRKGYKKAIVKIKEGQKIEVLPR